MNGASPFEAFFETMGLHRDVAEEMAAGGITTLEGLGTGSISSPTCFWGSISP